MGAVIKALLFGGLITWTLSLIITMIMWIVSTLFSVFVFGFAVLIGLVLFKERNEDHTNTKIARPGE